VAGDLRAGESGPRREQLCPVRHALRRHVHLHRLLQPKLQCWHLRVTAVLTPRRDAALAVALALAALGLSGASCCPQVVGEVDAGADAGPRAAPDSGPLGVCTPAFPGSLTPQELFCSALEGCVYTSTGAQLINHTCQSLCQACVPSDGSGLAMLGGATCAYKCSALEGCVVLDAGALLTPSCAAVAEQSLEIALDAGWRLGQ
jgi:hypothetical protein